MLGADLLIEFLSEELPSHNLENFAASFANYIKNKLDSFTNETSQTEYFISPRRFACHITNVLNKEPAKAVTRKGPAINTSLKDGVATNALLGFARSCGVEWNQLQQGADGYFYHSYTSNGNELEQVLPTIIADALKQLPVAKMMRWGDTDYQFVRPLHNWLLTYDNQIICKNSQIIGMTPNNYTYGHRIMSSGKIVINKASDYANTLQKHGFVVANFAVRRQLITQQLDDAASKLKLKINPMDGLLDEVTALVEYPVVLIGEFDSHFLEVPQECLILSMAKNQKYFALLDNHNKLSNKFLFVANLESKDPQVIINGNQKVLSARLADAKFFYDVDKKHNLEFFAEKLSNVVYHNKLGTQLQRIIRLQNIAGGIAQLFDYENGSEKEKYIECVRHTAYLIKADLTTEMVGEFPELQGIMGKYYAQLHGESAEVARAIEEHYYPRFSGDSLPSSRLGVIMSLSDKLETLVGIWGVGLIPTGDKDPFALRRAALGVARILLQYKLDLQQLLDIVSLAFSGVSLNANTSYEISDFIRQRLFNYLIDIEGYPSDCVKSLFAFKPSIFVDIVNHLNVLQNFASNPNNKLIIEANKRIENILKKNLPEELENNLPDKVLFQTQEEHELYELVLSQKDTHGVNFDNKFGNIEDYFKYLESFNKPVADFFDNVMVMDENINIRNNRFKLLKQLYEIMNSHCKLSELCIAIT